MRKKLKLEPSDEKALQAMMRRPAELRKRLLFYLKWHGVDVAALENETIWYDAVTSEAVIGEPEIGKPAA